MNKNKKNRSQNMLVAIGLLNVLLGIFLLINSFTPFSIHLYFFRPTVLFILGGFFLYRLLTSNRRPLFVFLSIVFLLAALLFLLADSGLTQFSTNQLWPFFVVFTGLALFPSGYLKYKRLHPVFSVPAIMLFFMGLLFLLFSFDIIEMSLLMFAMKWWPLLFIFVGLGLILLFFYNQNMSTVSKKSETSLETFNDEDDI
ncbi:MAG: LiaI-LiaF-like domain-containing protein [Treponemataceae bacterium]